MHPTVFIYDLKIIAQTQKALELKVALRAVERIMLVLTLREKIRNMQSDTCSN